MLREDQVRLRMRRWWRAVTSPLIIYALGLGVALGGLVAAAAGQSIFHSATAGKAGMVTFLGGVLAATLGKLAGHRRAKLTSEQGGVQ